jgi:hypothetical protein
VLGAGLAALFPGGRLGQATLEATLGVLFNAIEAMSSDCKDYTTEQALLDFAVGMVFDLGGEKLLKLIAKYGTLAIEKGLKKLGIADAFGFIVRKLDLCSFSEDTLVSVEDGLQTISTLEVGDYVLAYDEASDSIGYYSIISVWVHKDPVVVHLTIDGELIETTPEHPFYTADGEWVTAGALHVGDKVWQDNGGYGVVEAVAFAEQPQWMYNLTVDQAHTFFVGEGQWLVHNNCGRWVRVNEHMSPRAAAYQAHITGLPADFAYVIEGVKFDGFIDGHLLEAKGPGYATFVENGQFLSWFEGQDVMLDQARRQINAANGRHPIVWHVAESETADAIRNLFGSNGIRDVAVRHTP